MAGAGNHVVSCQAHNGAVDPQGQYAYLARLAGRSISASLRSTRLASKRSPTLSNVAAPTNKSPCRRTGRPCADTKDRKSPEVCAYKDGHGQRRHPRIVWRREQDWKGAAPWQARLGRANEACSSCPHPPTVTKTETQVGYGRGTTVSGWQPRADRARRRAGGDLDRAQQRTRPVHPSTATTTAANGSWSVQPPPGPHDSLKPPTVVAAACCRRPRHSSS